jgi:tRNA(Ile)-lysidine synthase
VKSPRHSLEETVRRTIREGCLIEAGETVLVGVSGGVDSSTLLFLLHKFRTQLSFNLAVAHVNHMLRGKESDRDEVFVREVAANLGLPFHGTRADVKGYAHTHGMSVQHAGRDLRYRHFSDVCEQNGYQKIAVAHHRDDQVETFLLRIIKGTGIHGLSSIPMKRDRIIRPLLLVYRPEIETYAQHCSIPFVQDSSNAKDGYERNFLRNRILPLMAELNPAFREKVLSLLRDLTAINDLFDEQAAQFLENIAHAENDEVVIGTEKLKELHPEVRFRVISRLLSRLEPRFIPLREHMLLVEKSLFSGRPNNRVTLPYGIRVKRVYGDLVVTRKEPRIVSHEVFEIGEGENELPALGCTLTLSSTDEHPSDFPKSTRIAFFDAAGVSRLTVRTFREGDRFVPLGMAQSVKLKDYFMSRKIPRERRRDIPLLLSRDDIIWVVGDRIDDRYKITDKTTRFLKVVATFRCKPVSSLPLTTERL